jgi:hypothetical protein
MHKCSLITLFGLIGLFDISSAATIDLSAGLVGEYLFNGNANDSSGNGKNGVINNLTLTADRFGVTGAAYNFSGNYSYITIPTLLPNIGAGGTLFTWFKADPTQLFGQQNIISQPRGNRPFDNQLVGFRLQINTGDGSSNFRVNAGYNDNTQNSVAFGPDNTAVADGNWHSMAATLFTDSTSRTLSVYFDGVFAESVSLSPLSVTSDVPFYIGTQFDPATTNNESPFIGAIDDVRIYDRALNAQEIQALSVPEPSVLSFILLSGTVLFASCKRSKNKI